MTHASPRTLHMLSATLLAAVVVAASCSSVDATPDTSAPAEPAAPEQSGEPEEFQTVSGEVRGVVDGETRVFRGVPYAQAPTGELRFEAPVPPEPWDEPFDAVEPGASCPQNPSLTSEFIADPPQDSDCLSLDVFAPADASDAPVMVWIHGGGFTAGSGHADFYDGTKLAEEGVVVVSINYRLGPFGFLAVEDSDSGSVTGNWGIQDQIAALEWVSDNVAGVGGDPGNVTVFGESAGGFSICGLLAADAADDLFDKAVMQSGGGCDGHQTVEDALADTETLLAQTSCAEQDDATACLRGLDEAELLEAATAAEDADDDFNLGLVDDAQTLSASAFDLAESNELGARPVLLGSNRDENTLFSLGQEEPGDAELRSMIASDIERGTGDAPPAETVDAVAALYDGFDTNLEKIQAFRTESAFTCPALGFSRSAADDAPVYLYNFTRRSPLDPFGVGATHGVEIVYLFGNPDGIIGLGEILQGDDLALADEIRAAWVGFAADGVPTAEPEWPSFTTDAESVYLWDIDASVIDAAELRDGRCDAVAELIG